jgi:hypothetical protein
MPTTGFPTKNCSNLFTDAVICSSCFLSEEIEKEEETLFGVS